MGKFSRIQIGCGLVLLVGVHRFSVESELPLFVDKEVNVGSILRGQTIETVFHFRHGMNIGAINRLNVLCSCGCMKKVPVVNETPQEGVTVSYTAGRGLGPFRKRCLVKDDEAVVGELIINGVVIPEIKVAPQKLTFGGSEEPVNGQLIVLTRIGLSKEAFGSIVPRLASPGIRAVEVYRDDHELRFLCVTDEFLSNEIESGIFFETDALTLNSIALGHVACEYVGPKFVPSAVVLAGGMSIERRQYKFRLIGGGTVSDAEPNFGSFE